MIVVQKIYLAEIKMDTKEFDMMLFLFSKIRKRSSQNVKILRRFFLFFKKHAEENHLRHERSLIVAVIVVLKSKFLILKQQLQNDEITNDKIDLEVPLDVHTNDC